MTMFTNVSAPWPTVLRIWDIICLEGKNALFRIALSFMKILERKKPN